MSLSGTVVKETGERVIPGSRRPDGTFRKERKIRDGYTPQEEQALYQSTGVLYRQGIPKCPGMDPALVAGKQDAKSKAAKKNEKRKAKRPEKQADEEPAASVSGDLQQLNLGADGAPPAADEGPAAPLERRVRALQKKLRQCEALEERRSQGGPLTQPEVDKLAKADEWRAEVAQLQEEIAALGTGS